MAKVIIKPMSSNEVAERGINNWPVWTKEISRFNWEYSGDEECWIIEGDITVETDEGTFLIKPGDFVTFKAGLQCVWDIKSPVKKYYNFP